MRLSEFDYVLPSELIAQRPIEDREKSRMLVLAKEIEHRHFYDITDYLGKDDVLVLNETKVFPSWLIGRKETGGRIEMILAPLPGELHRNETACRIKGRVGLGKRLLIGRHSAVVLKKTDDGCRVRFDCPISDVLKTDGLMPTPPYVKEKLKKKDRYQTTYAKNEGSVAAPTAGFHFTPELLRRLEKIGVKIVKLTLHVSFGTFIKIRSDNVLDHKMEKEYFMIPKTASDIINSRTKRLFVVGTTSLKALESAADKNGMIRPMEGWSDLFITPAYRFRVVVDGLITNFHLPKSTLLLLVSGFAGKDRILNAYKIAIGKRYRFYSFGDSMLILR